MKSKITIALLCLFYLGACNKNSEDKSKLIQVKTITAVKSNENIELESYGAITFKKKNDICALVDGTIVEQNAIDGSSVKKGDKLFALKNIQYQIEKVERENQVNSASAKVRAAKNNLIEQERNALSTLLSLENAKNNLIQKKAEYKLQKENLEKNQKLYDIGGISATSIEEMAMDVNASKTNIEILEKEYQIQKLGYEENDLLRQGIKPSENIEERKQQFIELNCQSAKIQIELAEVELENAERDLESINALIDGLTIRSPCDGIIASIYFENGERINQNDKVATVIDMDAPYAKITIQEKDLGKIKMGSPATVEIKSLNFKEESIIDYISPLSDSETGNFYVKIPITNKNKNIKLGMFSKCSIQTNSSGEYFILPESVVCKRNGNLIYLYCIQNDFIYQKECPVEMEKNGKIFIKSGINDGERIVNNPSTTLKEGLRVKCI